VLAKSKNFLQTGKRWVSEKENGITAKYPYLCAVPSIKWDIAFCFLISFPVIPFCFFSFPGNPTHFMKMQHSATLQLSVTLHLSVNPQTTPHLYVTLHLSVNLQITPHVSMTRK
jgi:hypothetical protein